MANEVRSSVNRCCSGERVDSTAPMAEGKPGCTAATFHHHPSCRARARCERRAASCDASCAAPISIANGAITVMTKAPTRRRLCGRHRRRFLSHRLRRLAHMHSSDPAPLDQFVDRSAPPQAWPHPRRAPPLRLPASPPSLSSSPVSSAAASPMPSTRYSPSPAPWPMSFPVPEASATRCSSRLALAIDRPPAAEDVTAAAADGATACAVAPTSSPWCRPRASRLLCRWA